ncbi:putative membrane protein [Allokutzneria albata]|uniref:Putative membrane protein n=2 Tax=Allokutzneria albata TaxID=211114 RepID=A0A1G9RYC3_ALLAB|nr:putative membrane protein [Allokutzneria albata]
MKSLRLVAAAGLAGAMALTGTAFAQAAPMSQPQADVQVAALVNPTDQIFLRRVHQGNLFEIAKGALAVEKGRCASVRRVGRVIARDHTRLDQRLRPVAERERVSLPDTPTRAQQALLRDLQSKSGTAFDRSWLQVQVTVHQQTLKLIQQELRRGQSPQVKQVAREALPVVEKHLAQVRTAQRVCRI